MENKRVLRSFMNDDFIQACHDYYYLIDRQYPEKGALKLAGDRYRLTGDQRTILYRGISSRQRAHKRRQLLTGDFKDKLLMVDGYNVLFTLINYRLGRILFISTDGILRDAGSLHGKLKEWDTLESCMDLMTGYIASQKPASADIYLDAPVSHSEKHAEIIRNKLTERGIKGRCSVLQSADWALRRGTGCILATSDTGIIEKALQPVTDLPAAIINANYKPEIPDLSFLLSFPPKEAQNAIDEG